MNKETGLQAIVALAVALAALQPALSAQDDSRPSGPPNIIFIIFILADDLGGDPERRHAGRAV
jgi:hypothetical protein